MLKKRNESNRCNHQLSDNEHPHLSLRSKISTLARNTKFFWASTAVIVVSFIIILLTFPSSEEENEFKHLDPCKITVHELDSSGYHSTPKKVITESIFGQKKIFSPQLSGFMDQIAQYKKEEVGCTWGKGRQSLWITVIHWKNKKGAKEFLKLSQLLITPNATTPDVNHSGLTATILQSLLLSSTNSSSYYLKDHQVFFVHLNSKKIFNPQLRTLEICIANVMPGIIIRSHGYPCSHIETLLNYILKK